MPLQPPSHGLSTVSKNGARSPADFKRRRDNSPVEWVKGPSKTVAVKKTKSKSPEKPSFDAVLQPTQSADPASDGDSDLDRAEASDDSAIKIKEQSLNHSSESSEKSEDNPFEQAENRPKKKIPKSSREKIEHEKLSDQGNLFGLRPSNLSQDLAEERLSNLTPNGGDSSNSDMRELKMALGGLSDRSGNALFNPAQNNENVIFSDEGSDDSIDLDEEDSAQIWERAQTNPKASI